jgi:hypothetical protein
MLSLDISKAEEDRYDFYKYLQGLGWEKFVNVDTVWRRDFPRRATDSTTILATAGEISEEFIVAAERFELKKINYVAQIGNSEGYARVVEKRFGSYSVFDA